MKEGLAEFAAAACGAGSADGTELKSLPVSFGRQHPKDASNLLI
jgi:hypothetical protein